MHSAWKKHGHNGLDAGVVVHNGLEDEAHSLHDAFGDNVVTHPRDGGKLRNQGFVFCHIVDTWTNLVEVISDLFNYRWPP